MRRFSALFSIFFLCVFSSCSSKQVSMDEGVSEQPNIILVLTDDQRSDMLPYMPTVTQTAGLSFENAYVTTSLCCPSRTSILTGEYAHNHGVQDNKAPKGGFTRFRDEKDDTTLATELQAAGYQTALVGKYLNDYGENGEAYVPEGWDWFYAIGGKPGYYNYDLLHYHDGENDGFVHYGTGAEDYSTDVLTAKSLDFIEQAEQPFFLYYAPFAPHTPSTAEADHEGEFDGDVKSPLFGEMVDSLQSVDDAFAEMLSLLEEQGELENTYIFFMSDNGYHLGENGIKDGKDSPYEVASNVPLKVFGPGIEAVESEALVLNIDLCPTFLDLAGAGEMPKADGRSFADLLRGDTLENWRTDFLLEGWNKGAYTALHEMEWVYIDYKKGTDELYNLASDPGETHNLIEEAANAERLETMKDRLSELVACKEEACW